MAQVFRPTYTHFDPATGHKTKRKCRKWYVRYYTPDGQRHVVPGHADKRATEALAAALERKAARLAEGIADPTDEHAKTPLDRHLADYVRWLADKGNTSKHVELTESRIRACLDSCRFIKIGDVQPPAVVGFLAELRSKGKSVATANHHLVAVKGFTRWLWKDRRTGTDPLAGLSKLANGEADIRHARRDLSPEELGRLLDTTRKCGRAFRHLTGQDRFMLYWTAAGTGFRAAELASLTPASFDLDATPPTIRVEAAYSKNRTEAVQPIPADLAEALRDWLAGKPADSPVWPGTWSNAASAKMIRLDLSEARKTWLEEAKDDPRERLERERSDFLRYVNVAGEHADFHALRHTYITHVVQRSGASPKTAQALARHGDVRLTLGRYAHVAVHDLAAAVEGMPSLVGPTDGRETLAATGTEGKPVDAPPNRTGSLKDAWKGRGRPGTASGRWRRPGNGAKRIRDNLGRP